MQALTELMLHIYTCTASHSMSPTPQESMKCALGCPLTHLYLIPFVCYKVCPPNADGRYFECAPCRVAPPTTGVTDDHPPFRLLPINEEHICGALGPQQVHYVHQLMEGGREGRGRRDGIGSFTILDVRIYDL